MNQYKKTWPISVEKEIDASTEKIWNIISKEGNLNLVHPFCKNNYALAWASENSVDVLEYLNGLTFIREFQTWTPGQGYSLLIGTKNGKKSYVEWKITTSHGTTWRLCAAQGELTDGLGLYGQVARLWSG